MYDLCYIIPLELCCIIMSYKAFKDYKYQRKGIPYWLFGLFITFFCTFYCWGYDYKSYVARFGYVNPNNESDYLELFYNWLIVYVTHDYLSWRFAVWGLATLCVVMLLKKLKVDKNIAIFLFVCIPLLQTFYVLRQSLAFGVLLYGVSIYYHNALRNNKITIIIAIVVILSSYFFHKSMPLYIAIGLFSILFSFSSKTVLISMIAFPFLYTLVPILINNVLSFSVFSDKALTAAQDYLESDYKQGLTMIGWIHAIMQRLPILIFIYSIYFKEKNVPLKLMPFLTYSYICVYISMLLFGQSFSEHISLRFWASALLPIVVFASANTELFSRRKIYYHIKRLVVLSFAITLFYNVYYVFKIKM